MDAHSQHLTFMQNALVQNKENIIKEEKIVDSGKITQSDTKNTQTHTREI